jgi:hypothetical protein
MKSIKLMIATAVLASLVFVLTTQQQNVTAFNDKNNQVVFNNHDHTQISEDHGIQGNDGTVFNDKTSHYNDNFNSNRGETFEERSKCNSHSKPANTDEQVIPCP